MKPTTARNWSHFTTCLTVALLGAAAMAGLGAASVTPATADDLTQLKLQIYNGGSQIPPLVAQTEGFFTKNGLEVELVPVQNGPQAINALLSGSVNFAIVAPLNTANLLAKGEKLSAVAGMQRNYMSIVGRKSASTSWPEALTQLHGKQIGVLALKGGNQLICEVALRAAGLSDSDYTFVATGGELASAAALEQGNVDAVCTSTLSQAKLIQEGYPVLFDFLAPGMDKSEYPPSLRGVIGLSFNQYWATNDWLSKNADSVAKFRAAMAQADLWMKDPKNFGALVGILRGSIFDQPSANDEEFATYVRTILSSVQLQIPETDSDTWKGIVKTAFDQELPPASEWIAAGAPATEDDVVALAGN